MGSRGGGVARSLLASHYDGGRRRGRRRKAVAAQCDRQASILGPVRREAPRRRAADAAPRLRARRRFRQGLLRWYARHQRDLPWRRTRDPYHVLVSEIMLQQTQVDRVIPKYHEFLARYPTLEALATADVADVTRTWYPLGYNIRPVHLHGIAREAVARYGGRLPDDDEAAPRA